MNFVKDLPFVSVLTLFLAYIHTFYILKRESLLNFFCEILITMSQYLLLIDTIDQRSITR